MSTISMSSAWSRMLSGTVSRTRMRGIRATTSLRLSTCWMFSVVSPSRPAVQDPVEIHLGQAMALVIHLASRDHREAVEQGLGLPAAVRLDDADDDVDALAPPRLRRQQHLIGLADAGRGAEKNLEPAAAFLLRRVEQRFRRGSRFALRHAGNIALRTKLSRRSLTNIAGIRP